ncbi:rheb-like protein Rhb1p [Trichomonascus vanleenenianus]|uniref:GTP-binding protein Rheb-like n=1 Tax=Trichomonascus vanleenenianus TaxID=2268995 RepID=UPI003ECAE256
MSSAGPRMRKVAVVGARSVGKSSLTVQFVEQHFVESYYPTIENQFSKIFKYRGQEYAIEILDTAGQDEFSIVSQKDLSGISGYVMIYSVASRSSFDMIRIIRDKILNTLGVNHVPIVVVGNKCDLHLQRQVTEQEGRELARQLNAAFAETSARHNENVDRAFQLLLGEIEKVNPSIVPKERDKGCTIS